MKTEWRMGSNKKYNAMEIISKAQENAKKNGWKEKMRKKIFIEMNLYMNRFWAIMWLTGRIHIGTAQSPKRKH